MLVIEDDPDTVTYLTAIFEDHGLKHDLARATPPPGSPRPGSEQPDLITLDINMPGRSGADVFTQLRSDPELTASIPVCVVTGAIDFRELMYHRNVPPPDGYLQKPIDPGLLMMTARGASSSTCITSGLRTALADRAAGRSTRCRSGETGAGRGADTVR